MKPLNIKTRGNTFKVGVRKNRTERRVRTQYDWYGPYKPGTIFSVPKELREVLDDEQKEYLQDHINKVNQDRLTARFAEAADNCYVNLQDTLTGIRADWDEASPAQRAEYAREMFKFIDQAEIFLEGKKMLRSKVFPGIDSPIEKLRKRLEKMMGRLGELDKLTEERDLLKEQLDWAGKKLTREKELHEKTKDELAAVKSRK